MSQACINPLSCCTFAHNSNIITMKYTTFVSILAANGFSLLSLHIDVEANSATARIQLQRSSSPVKFSISVRINDGDVFSLLCHAFIDEVL